jgi:hypothetical protein
VSAALRADEAPAPAATVDRVLGPAGLADAVAVWAFANRFAAPLRLLPFPLAALLAALAAPPPMSPLVTHCEGGRVGACSPFPPRMLTAECPSPPPGFIQFLEAALLQQLPAPPAQSTQPTQPAGQQQQQHDSTERRVTVTAASLNAMLRKFRASQHDGSERTHVARFACVHALVAH